jgi:predicted porin
LYLGVSFADATIYGTLEQTYNKSTTTLGGVVINTKTGMGEYQTGGSLIGFKGSEDLGSGMKASYLYEMGVNLQTSASAPSNRQGFVGLSGGFGSVRLGKQYSATFLNAVAADPGGATGATGALYLAPMVGYNGSEAPLRQDQGIQYDLPSFVDGLKLTLTKVFGGKNSALTNGSSGTETNGLKTGDGTGFAINYTSGPLYVGYATDSVNNKGINFGTTDTDPALPDTIIAASPTSKNKLNTLTATYNLGMAKLGYNTTKMSVGAQSLSTNMISVNVPLGAASVFLSSSSGKITSGSTLGAVNLSGSQYGVNYGLSKRTVAYVHAGKLDAELTSTTKKISNYGIGVHHSF